MDPNDDLTSVASTTATGARQRGGYQNAVEEGIRAGHINIGNSQSMQTVTMSFSTDNQETIQQHQDLRRRYDLERQARSVTIPTSDIEIKSRLRELREPITLFNEGVVERGERLRVAIARFMDREGRMPSFTSGHRGQHTQVTEDEEFYSVGSAELRLARLEIAKFSIPLASYRLEQCRRQRLIQDRLDEELKYEEYISKFGDYDIIASQFADDRCVSRGDLSYNNELYATSGWSGECKVWGIPDWEIRTNLKGHRDRVNHIKFHPWATKGLDENGPNIGTASADTRIRLWTLNPEFEYQKSIIFKGHEERVNYIEFHPTGKYFASSSHDNTLRFWDIERQTELCCQEGHIAAVYPLTFQNDGALLASGDLNGIVNIWDLRTGKSILNFVAHRRQWIATKFLPNWYQVATGGDDNQIKIWDLRKKSWVNIVPAHFKLISGIYFEPEEGKYMISTSYDGWCKIYNTRDWTWVRTLYGESKLSSASISKDTNYIVTTSFDRSMRLWEKKKPDEDKRKDKNNNEEKDAEMMAEK
jgi:U4/U6 small nuclear ribonucleoprotein PRP4